MTERIAQETVDNIIASSDISEVVSSYVQLKKTGINLKGLCPFHHEKTPSFIVSSEKQIFHCFGCGIGGNVITFLMKIDNISFQESLQYLGNRYNIPIHKENFSNKPFEYSLTEKIFKINQKALVYFHDTLSHSTLGKQGILYLQGRKISGEGIKNFSLGFSPNKWDGLTGYLSRKEKFGLELLLKAGLVKKRNNGLGYYDVFRNRVIFPIFDIQNRVIGFGGRTITKNDPKIPKYINTPDTPVFSKGKNLYGLNFSKDFIREKKQVIIVEGYLDFISLYRHGVKNIVATSGTALTLDQVKLLKRYAEEVMIVFDGDSAGQMAVERGYSNLLKAGGLTVRVIPMPQGEDPDSFINEKGVDSFNKKVKESKSFIDYMIQKNLSGLRADSPIEDKIKKVDKLLPLLRNISNVIEQASWVSLISHKLGLAEKALLKQLGKTSSFKKDEPSLPVNKNPVARNQAEILLLQLMLFDREKINEIKEFLTAQDFCDPETSKAATYLLGMTEANQSVSEIINSLHSSDKELSHFISRLALEKVEFYDVDKVMKDCIKKIRNKKLRLRMNELNQRRTQAAKLGPAKRSEYDKLQKEFNYVRKEMRL